MERLTIKELAPYLPYGLKAAFIVRDEIRRIDTLRSLYDIENYDDIKLSIGHSDSEHIWMFKPFLRPLSSLTEEINWGNQTYAIIDLFEIGDDGGYIYEYDHGNIKLISQLKTIAEYNYHHDINYLPYPVVQVLIEHHFDVFGLIDRSLALPIEGKEVEG